MDYLTVKHSTKLELMKKYYALTEEGEEIQIWEEVQFGTSFLEKSAEYTSALHNFEKKLILSDGLRLFFPVNEHYLTSVVWPLNAHRYSIFNLF